MRFGLTAEQTALVDALNRALSRVCPLDRARAFTEGEDGVEAAVFETLTDLGVLGVLTPEAAGGLGLGLLEAALTAETLGRAAAPAPFAATAGLAALALREAKGAKAADTLEAVGAGRLKIAVGLAPHAAGSRDGAGLVYRSGRLSGRSLFVLDAPQGGLLLLADVEGRLHLVDPKADGVRVEPLRTIDRTRRFGEAVLDAAPSAPLATPDGLVERLLSAACVLLAAAILGAAGALLEAAVAYAGAREQFGRPIGSFQAVKHLCAEMAAALEPARALVWYAAHAFDAGLDEGPLAALHAKAHLSEVGRFIARTATEVHGGAGFTDRQGIHLFFKRIEVDRQLFGGPEEIRRRAASRLGLAPATAKTA